MMWITHLLPQRARPVARLLASIIDGRSVRYSLYGVVLSIATALVTAGNPLILKYLIDGFHAHTVTAVVPLVGLWVLAVCATRVFGNLRSFLSMIVQQRTSRQLSRTVFGHMMRLPISFHLERRTGAATEAINKGSTGFQAIYDQVFTGILPLLLELGIMCLVLSRINQPVFVYYFLGALILYALAFRYSTSRQLDTVSKFNATHFDAHAALTDGMLNYESIKYFSAEDLFSSKYERALDRRLATWVAFCKSRTSSDLVLSVIFGAFLAATVLNAAWQVQQGTMSVGDFVLVQSYALQLVRPVEGVGFSVQTIFTGIGNLQGLVRILMQEAEPLLGDDRERLAPRPPRVEFRDVRFSYRQGHAALEGVSMVVPAGETLAIVGSSGAGKSTLMRLLTRLYEPDSGEILIDGVPLSQIPRGRLRRAISIVPQDSTLFYETIAFNIAVGKPDSSPAEIERVAGLAQLSESVGKLPRGLETTVGERGARLSGGERQRVALARAALRNPLIYVFDEATSSLDSRTEKEIMSSLRDLASRATTLIIAHRLSTIVHASQIVVLEGGRIVERGDHASLLRAGGRYAALWAAQHTPNPGTAAA